ncbi:helix-turn-helix domain-containing protein [Mycolicibacterium conceptionense]|uniref:HTH cro/C1-type domain-containing protein n=1 Tax=Mycolicibacterium conceptionense TaxID=451644 RepID=A0A1A2VF99_9MYCO|nr:helix-turn-helix transcriptional regulator [Mycolicibacterium conceptionense]OBF29810.1 hypothetical protein A5726_29870 [Mycolicibacterium conceptionense]OBF43756.1 hypothetical protein A5720_12110 [Mycolicibacterium conceptionense]OBH99346.1 hypothetical protein A5716_00190 [Mycolicibacterium conceptionense]
MTTACLPDGDPGINIRGEMGKRRISMVELSNRTDIPRSTLSYQINNGALTVSTLLRIAAALGVDPATLLPDPPAEASA